MCNKKKITWSLGDARFLSYLTLLFNSFAALILEIFVNTRSEISYLSFNLDAIPILSVYRESNAQFFETFFNFPNFAIAGLLDESLSEDSGFSVAFGSTGCNGSTGTNVECRRHEVVAGVRGHAAPPGKFVKLVSLKCSFLRSLNCNRRSLKALKSAHKK